MGRGWTDGMAGMDADVGGLRSGEFSRELERNVAEYGKKGAAEGWILERMWRGMACFLLYNHVLT